MSKLRLKIGIHEEDKKVVVLFEIPTLFLVMDEDEAEQFTEMLKEKIENLRSLEKPSDDFPDLIGIETGK